MWQKWFLLFLSIICRDNRALFCLQVYVRQRSVTWCDKLTVKVTSHASASIHCRELMTKPYNRYYCSKWNARFVWVSNKVKRNAESTWQCVNELMCPSWGKPRLPNFRRNIGTRFFCQRGVGIRAQVEGFPSRVKNASDHHADPLFFLFFFQSFLSPASKVVPRSFLHQPRTPETEEITLYQLSHKVTVKVGQRQCTSTVVWCSRPKISQTLQLSPGLEPSCGSNKWDTFHSDLRQRNTSLISFVPTKPLCLKNQCTEVAVCVVSSAEGICNLVSVMCTSGTSSQFDKEGFILTLVCPSAGFL